MRRVVSLQASTGGTRGADGYVTPVWKCKAVRRAARRPIRQTETDIGDQTQADADWLYEFRGDTATRAITGAYRLVDTTSGSTVAGTAEIYDAVTPFDPDGRGRSIHVRCKRRAV